MMKEWNSPVYSFFTPVPDIEYINKQHCHLFGCLAKGCKHKVWQYLDISDKVSTGNMRKHVRSCWGEDILKTICKAKTLTAACNGVKNYTDKGSITATFKQKGKGKPTYSHKQHTQAETKYVAISSGTGLRSLIPWFQRAEIVWWIAESLWPFKMVQDQGFQCLMKTGRPEYYIPHPTTISHGIRLIFANMHKRIAKMLRVSTLIYQTTEINPLTRNMMGS